LSSNPPAFLAISSQEENHQTLNERSRIPEEMQKGLRKNCEKKVFPEVKAKVRADEDTPRRFGDFEAALKDIINGGVPGPFMAIANIVKGWSTEVRKFAYTCFHYGKCERPLNK
jgi:hypothetical protein